MLRNRQSVFIRSGQPIPPAGRPSRMEERRVHDLIKSMMLDEDRIRARREDLWNDRYLCFTALRATYHDCPIKLAYEQIYASESRSLNVLGHLLNGHDRTAEYGGYLTVRRDFWATHPDLYCKPFGMVFTPIRQNSFVLHDSPSLISTAFVALENRDRINPRAHKMVYIQSWPSFLVALKKSWRPDYLQVRWDLYHAQQMEERDLNSIQPCASVASAGSSPIRPTRRSN